MSLFRYKGFYGFAQASIEDGCLFVRNPAEREDIPVLVPHKGSGSMNG